MSAPRWLRRLLVCVLLTQATVNIVRPVTSYRALALGADARAVGLLAAAFAILPVLVAIPLGRRADQRQAAPVLVSGVVLLAAGSGLLAMAGSLLHIATGNLVAGLGHLAFMVGGQTMVARQSSENNLDRNFGLFTAVTSLGQLAGPALGGLIMAAAPANALGPATTRAFGVASFLSVLALPACAGMGVPHAPGGPAGDGGPASNAWRILGRPGVLGGMFASLAVLAAVDVVTAYLPLLGERHGIGPAMVGALLSLRAASSVLSRLLVPRMVARWGRARLLVGSTLVSALTIALVPVAELVVILAGLLLLAGFALGVGQPLTMTLVVQAVPHNARGTAVAMRLTGNRLGQVTVPAAAGLVAGAAGVSVAFWLLGGLLVVATLGMTRRGHDT